MPLDATAFPPSNTMMPLDHSSTARLIDLALSLGATAASIVPAGSLVVEERLAALCAEPYRCPSYGLAPGCPPHALPPSLFRAQLAHFRHILAYKIDVPAADLLGERRLPVARTIHRIAAGLEQAALNRGFSQARGLAAGSCKELFCGEAEVCAVLHLRQPCPHADRVRPSLSAVGVDFGALATLVGWAFGAIDPNRTDGEPAMGLMAGLVLLG